MDNASLILEQITELKNKLESLVYLYGFSSPTVLKCSRELDELIFQIQLLNHLPLNRNDHKNLDMRRTVSELTSNYKDHTPIDIL